MHPAFQNFGKRCPLIDCDVLRSSTEKAMSTPLVHNIASMESVKQNKLRLPTLKCRRIMEFYHFRDLIP